MKSEQRVTPFPLSKSRLSAVMHSKTRELIDLFQLPTAVGIEPSEFR